MGNEILISQARILEYEYLKTQIQGAIMSG